MEGWSPTRGVLLPEEGAAAGGKERRRNMLTSLYSPCCGKNRNETFLINKENKETINRLGKQHKQALKS